MRVNRRPEGLSVARGLAPVLLRRGVLVGLLTAVCVLVSPLGASAAPPTTLLLCINPGGNVTSVVPPNKCGPNQKQFTAGSASDLAALQAQVDALQTKEAADVLALQTQEAADVTQLENAITALQAAIAALQTQEAADIEALQKALENHAKADAVAIAALQKAEADDAAAITALQAQLAPIITAVNAIKTTINGVIDAINTGIITPLDDVICTLSLGSDCSAIALLSHI